jgi:nicotinate-nucleotide adenylyltransferase
VAGRLRARDTSYTPPVAGAARQTRICERVGVLGGTFDPIHIAHLVAALGARHALGLHRVVLVVAGDPWQKRTSVAASAADRLAMARASIDGLDGLEVSAIEVERPGPSYTIDTLRALSAADRELFLIVGSDVAAHLDTWHEAEAVRAAATLVVVSRDLDARDLDPAALDPASGSPHGTRVDVHIPRLDIASSDLRGRVARGEPIDVLVPAGAVHVIRERHLYTHL